MDMNKQNEEEQERLRDAYEQYHIEPLTKPVNPREVQAHPQNPKPQPKKKKHHLLRLAIIPAVLLLSIPHYLIWHSTAETFRIRHEYKNSDSVLTVEAKLENSVYSKQWVKRWKGSRTDRHYETHLETYYSNDWSYEADGKTYSYHTTTSNSPPETLTLTVYKNKQGRYQVLNRSASAPLTELLLGIAGSLLILLLTAFVVVVLWLIG